jgi:hypothetical protein
MIDPVARAIAIYGAVLATLGIAWEIFKWWREQRTDVKVELSLAISPQGPLVMVAAYNRSSHTIRVPEVGMLHQDREGYKGAFTRLDLGDLPMTIPPHDSDRVAVDENALRKAGFDPYRSAVGYVRTSTDRTFRSKSTTLRKH